jgi:N-acetylmuramoyl-L-alanine amidase
MPNVKYLFFHTAAADLDDVDAVRIDEWHRAKGWSGIGYHYVIIDDRHSAKKDGFIERGRSEAKVGAHVLGANEMSLGVCCVGHGDRKDFTQAQKQSLTELLAELGAKYDVPVTNMLGHWEVNKLVDQGVLAGEFRTSKSCPGTKVSVDEIRNAVDARIRRGPARVALGDEAAKVREAILVLERNKSLLGNAQEEWRQFFNNGEVRGIVENA